jgi:hypothetical protein
MTARSSGQSFRAAAGNWAYKQIREGQICQAGHEALSLSQRIGLSGIGAHIFRGSVAVDPALGAMHSLAPS